MIASIKEFGFRIPILIRSDGLIIDGHLRKKAAVALGMTELPCIVADDMTDTQIKAFRLVANQSTNWATWDIKLLELELEDLKLENFNIDLIGFDDSVLEDTTNTQRESPYTAKIESPVYHPTGPCPNIKELVNLTKTKQLLQKIDESNLPEEEKEFLRLAAQRHTVFDYKNIAEYYAHASKEMQELMEDSALVIIDFNKAIEHGFVKLVDDLAALEKNLTTVDGDDNDNLHDE